MNRTRMDRLLDRYGERMSMPQVARELGFSTHTLRSRRSSGRDVVPMYLDGTRLFASTAHVAEYLDRAEQRATVNGDAA